MANEHFRRLMLDKMNLNDFCECLRGMEQYGIIGLESSGTSVSKRQVVSSKKVGQIPPKTMVSLKVDIDEIYNGLKKLGYIEEDVVEEEDDELELE